jgi:hypothetical protein
MAPVSKQRTRAFVSRLCFFGCRYSLVKLHGSMDVSAKEMKKIVKNKYTCCKSQMQAANLEMSNYPRQQQVPCGSLDKRNTFLFYL